MSIDNFDKDIADAQAANPDETHQSETTEQTTQEAAPEVDYKVKFVESSKEALRLLEEKKQLEREKAELLERQQADHSGNDHDMETLYPGFKELDPDAQANLLSYTEAITSKAKDEIYKDPAIAFARKQFNESTWDRAFEQVAAKYPDLMNSKEEFKSKYFNANNVPVNIDSILDDVAKIHLFDKAQELGAQAERARASLTETERSTGGDRDVKSSRTLDDWRRMAEENPAKFAQHSKEYHADLESGKLKS